MLLTVKLVFLKIIFSPINTSLFIISLIAISVPCLSSTDDDDKLIYNVAMNQAAREHREAEYKEFFNPDLFFRDRFLIFFSSKSEEKIKFQISDFRD